MKYNCRMRIGQDSVTWYDEKGNETMHIDSSNKVTLAQPEQDADRFCDANCTWSDHHPDCKYGKPEQRTWVDLTDEQMWNAYTGGSDIINLDYAKSIVALFKEKNT